MNTLCTMQGGISISIPKVVPNIAGGWSALGTGVNSEARTISAVDTSNVYVGGWFTTANGVTVNGIAKWDGSSWSALVSGLNNSSVEGISVLDASNIYVCGENFTASINGVWGYRVIKWSGTNWSTLGSGNNRGVDNRVFDVYALNTTNLYFTGQFRNVGDGFSVSAERVAKTDGAGGWSALGTGLSGGSGYAIWAIDTSNVYVGGDFTSAGGVANTANIAKWNGSAWSALGTGVNSYVWAISALNASNVYVGGDFITASGVTVNRIAKWDGSSWSALGSGTNGTVYAVHAYDASNIIIGGSFTTAGGVTCNRVAKWNGASWNSLGSGTVGVNSYVNAVRMVSPTTIYAGGAFTTAGGVSCNRIAKFTAT
jgi:hypothetical protein